MERRDRKVSVMQERAGGVRNKRAIIVFARVRPHMKETGKANLIAMDAMEGSRELSYDIASMDREHASQLGLFNDLKAAVRGGAPDSLVYSLLNDLVEHTNLHFLSEQLAMKLHAYEAYESHLVEHERLLAEVQSLKHSLTTGTPTDKHSLIEALRSWLVVHIQTADKTLAEYLSTRTARQATQES